jgi:hypothetical protein
MIRFPGGEGARVAQGGDGLRGRLGLVHEDAEAESVDALAS